LLQCAATDQFPEGRSYDRVGTACNPIVAFLD
jgi:hypothetical protein